MTKLYTVGYQGQTVDAVVSYLQSAGIELVIDVRQVPRSRKPGFSKHVFARNLATVGINYTHIVELGTPAALREEVRRTSDYASFREAYRAHLRGEAPALHAALALLNARPSCLLCFEQRPEECHRSVVAEELARIADDDLEIVNL